MTGDDVSGDRLLVATGRRPRVTDIGLETVGITAGPHGVPVDDRLRLGERLWAIGDVTGIWQLTHVGEYQGEIVASNILGEERTAHYEAVPRVTYTDPQAASTGTAENRFSGTARLSDVSRTRTFTTDDPNASGFLTLLSDGECVTGGYARRPRGRGVDAADHPGRPRARTAGDPARHDPAVPQLLRRGRCGGQGPPPHDRHRLARSIRRLRR